MIACQHEPQVTPDANEIDIGGVVAVDDLAPGVGLPKLPCRIWPCKHCGVPLDVGHDPRRRVTRSWLIEHGYNDPFSKAENSC